MLLPKNIARSVHSWLGLLLMLISGWSSAGSQVGTRSTPALLPPSLVASLSAREYWIREHGADLQAPNRAHGFRSYFSGAALRLVARESGAPIATLKPTAMGRADALVVLPAARLGYEAATLAFDWPSLRAQIENPPAGLATTYTLPGRPGELGALTLQFMAAGAGPEPQVTERSVWLQGEGGALRWQLVSAQDAAKVALPVVITWTNGVLNLSVDDRGATYPIAIKTLITEAADAAVEVDQADANLGLAVANAGDLNGDGFADVVVGAPFYDLGESNEGATFVFLGGLGLFNTVPDVVLHADQANAQFGQSVAGAGDVNGDGRADVIVGAPRYDQGEADEGAAFVYLGLAATPSALLEMDQAGAFVGSSVAGAGDVNGDGYADVVVGANNFSHDQAVEGAALIYFGGPGAFDPNADAQLESNQATAYAGWSVSGAGDVNGDGYADVLVGIPGFDAGQTDEGVAWLYLGGPGSFDVDVDAQLEANQAGASAGISVAGAGDLNGDGYADVFVGAPQFDATGADTGAALVYFGGPGAFNTVVDAQLSSPSAGARLGASVGGAGDVNGDGYADLIAGAPNEADGQFSEGVVRVYFGGRGALDLSADALLQVDQVSAGFGAAVAGGGDVNGDGYADVIAGAPFLEHGETNEGAAFIYLGSNQIWDGSTAATLEANQADAQMGASVAGAGDVDGDGYGDVIVGAPAFDTGQTNAGAAFIYLGTAIGLAPTPAAQLQTTQAFSYFGNSVDGAGDVNGDGYADVIVGAPGYDNGQPDQGGAYIYFGSASVFDPTADALLQSNQANAAFGHDVAGAGDLNGDGYDDVIVGAPYQDNGQTDEGLAFVYYGGARAFDTLADARLEVDLAGANLGYSVDGAGYFNADGYADAAAGAPGLGGGAAYVFFGSAQAMGPGYNRAVELLQNGAGLGFSLAGVGDVDGDGRADLLIGAPYYDAAQADVGTAVLIYGGFQLAEQIIGDEASANLGYSVAAAGDVNADGHADLLIGAPYASAGQTSEGISRLYLGASVLDMNPDAQFESNQAGANAGASVDGAGDVNGDGYADLVVGVRNWDGGQADEGAAVLYLGNRPGRALLVTQYRAGGEIPVVPAGLSQSDDGYVVAVQASSPRGREAAKLEVEACRYGQALGSIFCQHFLSPDWIDLGTDPDGRTLAVTTTGMSLGEAWRWRARVLYAPATVGVSGAAAPLSPPTSRWVRPQARTDLVDIRIGVSDSLFINGFE